MTTIKQNKNLDTTSGVKGKEGERENLSNKAPSLIKLATPLLSIAAAALLSSCSGSGSFTASNIGSGANNYNLVMDNTSPVPLVGGNAQQFYVYVTNTGNGNATNLNWSLSGVSSSKTTTSMLFNKFKSLVGLKSNQLQDSTTNGINIADASDCTNVNAGQNCRILMNATSADALILQAKSNTSSGSTNAIVQSTVSSYSYNIPATVNPAGSSVLTLSPVSNINYGNGFKGQTFFIINNGNRAVSLSKAPLGTSAAGINVNALVGASCPDPLPGGTSCQVRLTVGSTNGSSASYNTSSVNLVPTGQAIEADGSKVDLAPQQGVSISLSNEKVGYPSLTIPTITASQSGTNSVIGIISNTGSAPLTIGTLSSSTPSLVISNDNCRNQTIAVGASCTYTASVDYASLHGSGQGVVTVPYNDGKKDGTTSTTITWTYVAEFVANPSVTITSSGKLTQDNRTQTITVSNSGNVALTNITAPSIKPSNSQVTLSGSCPSPLESGASCSYTLTYIPVAPSQTTSITISGVSASYVDEHNNIQTFSSTASTAVNLSAVFTGFIKTGGDIALSGTSTSKTITLENTGNYDATLSNISVSGTNLRLGQGTCTNGSLLKVGGSCTLSIGLSDATTAGSGNGNLNITYDNHNGNAATIATSNIDWTIGSVASLKVSFAQSNLFVAAGSSQDVEVTLLNDGNDPFSNITLPTLPAGFSWVAPATDACSLEGTQLLAIGASCKLTLHYAPTSAASGQVVTIGKFSATSAVGGSYSSANNYSVTATAVTSNELGGLPSNGITQNPSWAIPNPSSTITITNNSGREITFTGAAVSAGLPVSILGCSGKLAAGASCSLTVTGNYDASTSGSVTINYTDNGVALSQSVNVVAAYAQKPAINPSMMVIASPSGEWVVPNNGTEIPITLTLSNTTTVSNPYNLGSDGTIQVLASSLLPTSGDLSYEVKTGGSCIVDTNGYITLSNEASANSCTYEVAVKSTAAPATSGSSIATPSYTSVSYSDTSTIPGTQSNSSSSGYGVSYTVLAPTANLSTPTLSTGQIAATLQNVEQGTMPSPSLTFKVKNVGVTAIAGNITTSPNVAGLTVDTSSCNNLASGGECEITVTMDTSNLLSGRLSAVSLNFSDGTTAGTVVALPDLTYSVIAPAAPAITTSMSVANCQAGSAAGATLTNLTTLPTCNINTGNNPAPVVTITFTNTGAGAATNFTVTPATLQAALGSNYSQSLGGTCGTGTTLAASNGSCTVIINPTTADVGSNDAATQYDIAATDGVSLVSVPYSYNYGTASLGLSGNGSANIGLDANIATAGLTITATTSPLKIKLGASSNLTVTASNWYTTPANPIFMLGAPMSAVGLNTISSCDFAGGITCVVQVAVAGDAKALGSYTLIATSSGISSSGLAFSVVSPWETVGNAGFSSGTVLFTSLALYNGTPYVAYQDANSGKATVMKYDGSSWAVVGNSGFSAGRAPSISLAMAPDGTPYVSYVDVANGNKATVMKYNGSSWGAVGSAGFSSGTTNLTSMAIAADGTPYIAFQETNNKATVMKYDGSTNSWLTVGNAGFSVGTTAYNSLALYNGMPYVAYQDGANGGKATVMKYDGSSWGAVGNAGFSAGVAAILSLAIAPDGTPYVAYRDVANGNKATVMKYDGSSWGAVGNAGFSAGTAASLSLAIAPDSTPYVAYQDGSSSAQGKATVMRYVP